MLSIRRDRMEWNMRLTFSATIAGAATTFKSNPTQIGVRYTRPGFWLQKVKKQQQETNTKLCKLIYNKIIDVATMTRKHDNCMHSLVFLDQANSEMLFWYTLKKLPECQPDNTVVYCLVLPVLLCLCSSIL